ncbi:MAG: methionine adenosyltransferase [Planctomycetota bacterium]
MPNYYFTSESVSCGHPDKVADQISDAILDAMIGQDPDSRVACETMVSTGMAVIAGEVKTKAYVEISDIVRETIEEIGYTDGAMRFDSQSCAVLVSLKQQSPEITQGVERDGGEIGAGDQGLMFGFACKESEDLAPGSYMPLPIFLSHRLVENHKLAREANTIEGLRPDAKSQVTFEYDETGRPIRVDTVVLSTQHDPRYSNDSAQKDLHALITDKLIRPTLGDAWWNDDIKIHVNPTGLFEIGGPHGDVGLTGRKIIVDTYGGTGRHGGGAFSGKDPTKVDRSAAYMARYIAKNVVAAGLAEVCEIQLSYAIGVAEPTSVRIDTKGTASTDEQAIVNAIRDVFSLTPRGIITSLNLLRPIYRPTARHGHFGRVAEDGLFTWEATDKVEALRNAVGSTSTAGAAV